MCYPAKGTMHKTVIGSWPVFYGEHGKAAIRMAVEDQVAAGVDVISDGQTRKLYG